MKYSHGKSTRICSEDDMARDSSVASQRNRPLRSLLTRVKRAVLVLLESKSITSLGEVPSEAVHCQWKLPSPLTEQVRVRLGETASCCTTGKGGKTRNGGSAVGTCGSVVSISGGGNVVGGRILEVAGSVVPIDGVGGGVAVVGGGVAVVGGGVPVVGGGVAVVGGGVVVGVDITDVVAGGPMVRMKVAKDGTG